MKESDFVTIATFNSNIEAQLCLSRLESEGIACSLIHQTLNEVLPLHFGFMPVELVVAEADAARAIELLEKLCPQEQQQ